MKRLISLTAASMLIGIAIQSVHAEGLSGDRINRGHDPFFQISKSIAGCPEPLGPLVTEQEWLDDSHYRVERGNSCWVEGRCRLSNGYLYDNEIAEAVQRRLNTINYATHWREQSTLWLTLQRRFIYVEGCIAPGFNKSAFLADMAKTADVDRVIDNTTTHPHATSLPYKTRAEPDKPVLNPGN